MGPGGAAFVFGNGQLWITDSVESNYALTAKEMVLSGDWISPQIYGNYWYDKPVFFTGLRRQALKFLALTNLPHAFSLRCSAWQGLGCWFMPPKTLRRKTAFWSGVILMTSTEFFLISKSVITDSTLFFFFSMALVFFTLGTARSRKITITACIQAWRWQP